MPYTTQHCKDFLNANLKFSNTNWKRTSKKNNGVGILRVFECPNNSVLVEVLETSSGLSLGRQFILNTDVNAPKSNSAVEPTIGSIFGALASNLVASVKSVKSKIEPHKDSNSAIPVNLEKVDFTLARLKAMVYECDWSEILLDGVEYVAENGETVITCPGEEDDFHLALNKAIKSYFNLNKQEKKELAIKAAAQDIDFFHTFVFTINECVSVIVGRNYTYIPYHIGQHFDEGSLIGFVDLLDLIKETALSQASATLPINEADFNELEVARNRLLDMCSNNSLAHNIDTVKIACNIKEVKIRASTFSVSTLKLECEKARLQSTTPHSLNFSVKSLKI